MQSTCNPLVFKNFFLICSSPPPPFPSLLPSISSSLFSLPSFLPPFLSPRYSTVPCLIHDACYVDQSHD